MAKGGRYLSPEKMVEFAELMAAGKKDEALKLVSAGGHRGSWDESEKAPVEFLNEKLENGTLQVVVRTSRGTMCISRDSADLKRHYIYIAADDVWPEKAPVEVKAEAKAPVKAKA